MRFEPLHATKVRGIYFHQVPSIIRRSTHGFESGDCQQVQFLQTQNQILQSKLPRIVNLTEREKQRLLRFGRVLGGDVKHLVSVVSYRTFCRWLAGDKKGKKPKKKGRPCKPVDIVELVCRLARENGWGYGRILSFLSDIVCCLGRGRDPILALIKG